MDSANDIYRPIQAGSIDICASLVTAVVRQNGVEFRSIYTNYNLGKDRAARADMLAIGIAIVGFCYYPWVRKRRRLTQTQQDDLIGELANDSQFAELVDIEFARGQLKIACHGQATVTEANTDETAAAATVLAAKVLARESIARHMAWQTIYRRATRMPRRIGVNTQLDA